MEAVKGHRCEHVHTDDCYTDELICGYKVNDGEAGREELATDSDAAHEHNKKCYERDCPHERREHDDDCGYVEAVKGHPCGFVCDECDKKEPEADSGNNQPEADSGNNQPAPDLQELEHKQPEKAEVFTITDFDGLDERIQFQSVSPGTKLDELNLPATLGASGCTIEDDTASAPEPITIKGVTWELTAENNDGKTEYGGTAEQGGYIFSPVLPTGYTCAEDVDPPEIFVRIGEANLALANAIDDYDPGDVAAFQAILDAHPSLLSGSVDREVPDSWTQLMIWDNSSSRRIVQLNISNKGLTGTLDVSDLTSLTYLSCFSNSLTGLTDLDKLTELTDLICFDNHLTTLDVSGLTSLTDLDCSTNQLKALDVSGLTSLTHLVCYRNELETLSGLGSLTSLDTLDCSQNELKALDVSGLTSLTRLHFSRNPLTSFTPKVGHTLTVNQATGGTVWTTGFDLDDNRIALKAEPDAGFFFQEWTELPPSVPSDRDGVSFALVGNMTVEAAFLAENPDDADRDGYHDGDVEVVNAMIDTHGLTFISKDDQVNWAGKGIAWDNSIPKRITSLNLANKGLTGALDVSGLTALTRLECYANQLETLDVSGLTKLAELYCSNNQLAELKGLGDLTALNKLNCDVNQLEALTGLEKLKKLSYLDCYHNQLKGTLDVNGLTELIHLGCAENQLTELNVSSLTNLTDLECFNNPFASFKINDSKTLTVTPTIGGMVWTTNFNFSNNKIILEAIPDTGFSFQKWTKPDSISSDTNMVSFTLDGNITVAANFKENYMPSTDATLQSLSLSDGITLDPAFHSAITEYKASVGNDTDTITITATPGDSKANVEGDGTKSLKVGPNEFTITVTAEDKTSSQNYIVTITREKAAPPSGGGSSSGGSDSSQSHTITTPQPLKPNNPVLAEIELSVTVGNGTATGQPDDARTAGAIAEAQKNGKAGTNGIALQYRAKATTAYDGFSITIRRATLDRFIDAKVKYITLDTGIVDLTFDLAALQEIQKQTTGDITLTATRETGLNGDALAAVGTRPAYRLTVGYTGQDGTAAIQNFGVGRITVGLAYKPAENEQTGSLFLVYSRDGKEAQWLYQSSYDLGSGNVIGSTGHFSVYGVGCKPAPAFADTVNHWAKADIDFVASRGLLAGTGETTFTPDGTMTRGMFAVALGRLAGIDPAVYPSSRFSDVAATDYYAPYVEWAASKGIVTGTSETTFAPDAVITREQMAVIMQRYANQMGHTLPVAREAENFTDSNKISSGMKEAVQTMQQAGVMNGKGRLFAPKNTATRADAAAVLRRFVEIVIDPGAAGGWGQDDAGSWLYYENNKPVTGWKQIEGIWYYFDAAGLMQSGGWRQISGKWYYFYADGSMAANTEIDGCQIGPDGARNS